MQRQNSNRRQFVSASTGSMLVSAVAMPRVLAAPASPLGLLAQESTQKRVQVDLPRGRVPLSFIIDDSTCLVNMGKFCMPQFAATYPSRKDYQLDWRSWPAEIPDAFVREFGEWCAEQGVKGKYSVVPNPACVGWMDRELPGWSLRELRESLALVRNLLTPNWDIHPEMITHTRVIDLKTGRPFADNSPAHMENSYPQEDVSIDYLASYFAYALKILKNCDLHCDGITTPGGFGNRVKEKLPFAVQQAVTDVFGSEVPHYFKYVKGQGESTEPTIEAQQGVGKETESLIVNVPAGTGDWFGGWTGVQECTAERYANEDATTGRMVELIQDKQPAIMLCHWPGMYCNGSREGFRRFQDIVLALSKRFSAETQWMKLSEISRYWAAKQVTQLEEDQAGVDLNAKFHCNDFTLSFAGKYDAPSLRSKHGESALKQVHSTAGLSAGTYFQGPKAMQVCFNLDAGESRLEVRRIE